MKLLMIFALFIYTSQGYTFIINDYIDKALDEFASKVVRAGDDVVPLRDPILIGGFSLTAPVMKNMSTLKRVGNATFGLYDCQYNPNVVVALSFDELLIEGEKIEGLGKNVVKPRITVRENQISVYLSAFLDRTRLSCTSQVQVQFTDFSFVILDGTSIDDWMSDMYRCITPYLEQPLTSIIQKHVDFCQELVDNDYKMFSNSSAPS